ncbi:hypothetical protein BCR36DRAFT_92919 [Piromyces finnis]|uniref:G-protein coupled receptors family 3 profile domain-containing protein n=1 Tax=Piromyces finnis TaxID=1754191 RepID=A0A1Y1V558_9FUNG|nr:hypothetical protein BCR36DRAFT_92919 [Piromyces finnis]|eukprot:ORX47573.1 hypothetical protein BCR36DRAFT_92919 [Piromyces finnis]
MCNIYDDYNNLIIFESDISIVKYEEFMFFNLWVDDSYNVELIGQTQSFCWGDSCKFPSIKVIGNPGNYTIKLSINSFGQFSKFDNSTIGIPIEIMECNNNYINQKFESNKLKSCYEPKCELSCGQGRCVNINLCDCTETLYTGKYCNENYKLNRKKYLDNIILSTTVVLFIITIVLIILTIVNRKNPKIMGGGVDFLIIILLGSIIRYGYILLLTKERTTTRCYLIYLFNNIGFSLVFGSILVKTLRIYRIFKINRQQNVGIKKGNMYAIIISIVSFHIVVVILWSLLGRIKVGSAYTNDKKVYQKCFYSKTSVLCVILNYTILLIGFFTSYSIRRVQSELREHLNIPVYVYVITMGIIEFINLQDEISLEVQDLFGSLGTIINTSVILYFLYISKFFDIYIYKNVPKYETIHKM